MKFGEEARAAVQRFKTPLASLALVLAPQLAWAQRAAASAADRFAVAPGGYVPMKPTTEATP